PNTRCGNPISPASADTARASRPASTTATPFAAARPAMSVPSVDDKRRHRETCPNGNASRRLLPVASELQARRVAFVVVRRRPRSGHIGLCHLEHVADAPAATHIPVTGLRRVDAEKTERRVVLSLREPD